MGEFNKASINTFELYPTFRHFKAKFHAQEYMEMSKVSYENPEHSRQKVLTTKTRGGTQVS